MRCPHRLAAARLAAALLAAIALLPASFAAAATLQVSGPAGASLAINGSVVGFLPLSGPLTVAPGDYELACELPGLVPHRQHLVLLTDDEWRHVTVRLLPYSRKTAVLSNVLLAGLGPRYLGHSTRGWIYSAAEIGGLLTALYGEITRSNANDEYLLAMDAYGQAVNQDELEALRAAADAQYQEVVDAADLRDLGLLTAAGAIVVSMVDSWFSFNAVAAGAGDLPAAGGGDASGSLSTSLATPLSASPSFHMAVRLGF